jgi:AraC-like DNA-binding protein
MALMPDEVSVLSPGAASWHTTSGPGQFASMSLPQEDIAEVGSILAGQDITPTSVVMTAKIPVALLVRLQSLHAATAQLAEHAPQILANAGAARGLEALLTDAMTACLATGGLRIDSASQRRHATIMKRLHALEEANRGHPLYLSEVCAALNVSQRTLHHVCQELLGIGPKRYLCLRRLHLVHRELRRALPGQRTVTDIAMKYGFWELGRFAVVYREVFGQSPSATLGEVPDRSPDEIHSQYPYEAGLPGPCRLVPKLHGTAQRALAC